MLFRSNVNFSLEIYAPTSQNSPSHLPYTSVPLRDTKVKVKYHGGSWQWIVCTPPGHAWCPLN